MMRTSASQFWLLVEYMERHGDLSKPLNVPQGRATLSLKWAELAGILNADATGEAKSADKWRKVWSDLKNNTKKKAAKMHRAASGTGGGPAIQLQLSTLEERVLQIIGPQAATGMMEIAEVGIQQQSQPSPIEAGPLDSMAVEYHDSEPVEFDLIGQAAAELDSESPIFSLRLRRPPPPSSPPPQRPLSSEAGPVTLPPPTPSSALPLPSPLRPLDSTLPSQASPLPSLLSSQRQPPATAQSTQGRRQLWGRQSPTPLPRTPRRRRPNHSGGAISSPLRRSRAQTQADLARQAFVRSDCEWREFQMETERRRTQQRDRELDQRQQELDQRQQELDQRQEDMEQRQRLHNQWVQLIQTFGNRIINIFVTKQD